MKITRTSPVTGETLTRDLDVTQEQYKAWQDGMLIQDAMPNLSSDDREWIISGCTIEDWHRLWSEPVTDAPIPF